MKRFLLAVLLMLGGSATAFAQLGEIWLSFGNGKSRDNSLGTFDLTGTGSLSELKYDTGFRFEARLGLNNEGFFGHEFGYGYTRGQVKTADNLDFFNMSMHQGTYNFLLYALREGSPVRPYATGGVHFSSFYPPGASAFSGNGITKFGFNYGGGVKARIGTMYAVRVDVRDYWQGKPDFGGNPEGLLKIFVVSAGFGIVF